MAVSDWSTTADSNSTVDSINIAEGCNPGNINGALRAIMASVRVMYDNLPSTTSLMPKAGGTFSGTQPIYASEGAFLHHASSSFASGKVHILAEGSANPSGLTNGDIIFYYTP